MVQLSSIASATDISPLSRRMKKGHRVSQRHDQSGDEKQERPSATMSRIRTQAIKDPEIIARQSERANMSPIRTTRPRTHIQEEPLTSRGSTGIPSAATPYPRPCESACSLTQPASSSRNNISIAGRRVFPPSGETDPGRRTYRVGFQVPFHVLPMFFSGVLPSQPGTEKSPAGPQSPPPRRKEQHSECRHLFPSVPSGSLTKRFLRLNHDLGRSFSFITFSRPAFRRMVSPQG